MMTLRVVKLKSGLYLIYRHKCMKHHFIPHKEQRLSAFEKTRWLQLFTKMALFIVVIVRNTQTW